MGDLVIESLPIHRQPAQFDLTLMMAEMGDCIAATLHYNTDLFDKETARRMLRHFETLLTEITADPDQPVGRIPLLAATDRHELLVEWNATHVAMPPVDSIHQLFEARADESPNAVALVFEKERVTYRELNERANRIAHRLTSMGVGPEKLVAVLVDRSPAMMASLLAVHKAGGAYVPLDPEYPQERLRMILTDSEPMVILTQERLNDSLSDLDSVVVTVDSDEFDSEPARNPQNVNTPDGLAYVIYTSGSTGIPKGVEITHRGMVNFLNAMQLKLSLSPGDRLLAVTTLSFDIAVLELFLPLTVGACVEIASSNLAKDGAGLAERLETSEITVMQATPATWRIMIEAGWNGETRKVQAATGDANAGLTILCGGEALPRALANALIERGGKTWNLYGPTETAVWSTMHEVQTGAGPLPIGRPIGNTRVYVLDTEMQPVPAGVVGELYIGGNGVARGYRNRPDLTEDKFVPDPFCDGGGARLYRTGDLARWRNDGQLMFLGRIDDQVKVRGFRIELGEIETALTRHPAIRQSVVVARSDGQEENRLVAYSVLEAEQGEPSVSELRSFLRDRLPEYMLPAAFVTLDEFPQTPNGKVNRSAFPAPKPARANLGEPVVPPRNEQEEKLAALWTEILGVERAGVHDDFFDSGGNSLSATRLVLQIHETFGVKLQLITFFQTPTIAGLSQAIDKGRLAPVDGFGMFETVSLEELTKEAVLDPTIAANGLKYEPVEHPRHILLTGATGFLGAYLLQGLLEKTDASIFCVVRAKDRAIGAARLRKNLDDYSLWNDEYRDRIVPVPGDLERPWLGLSRKDLDEVTHKAEAIYHNGAMVNLIYPYQSHQPANVGGTIEILRLAAAERVKPVHLISSLSVLHTPEANREGAIPEDVALVEHGVPLGGYEQSKWVAELLVQEAGARGIPYTIFRPGLIAGHSQTGNWNQDDLMLRLLDAALTLGAAPNLDMRLDVVPVDFVADAVVHIANQPSAIGKTFHLCAAEQLRYKDLINNISDQARPLQILPYDDWKRDLFAFGEKNPEYNWNVYLPLIDDVDIQVVSAPSFAEDNTKALLEGTTIQCPPLGTMQLQSYFRHFAETGRFKHIQLKNEKAIDR